MGIQSVLSMPRRFLVVGLNGKAEIRTQQETEGLLIPSGALFSAKGRDVVYRIENGVPEKPPAGRYTGTPPVPIGSDIVCNCGSMS